MSIYLKANFYWESFLESGMNALILLDVELGGHITVEGESVVMRSFLGHCVKSDSNI